MVGQRELLPSLIRWQQELPEFIINPRRADANRLGTAFMFNVTLRFYEELNDFLPLENRKRTYTVTYAERRSAKDLIESEGVPHTEIDLILVNGESTGFDRPRA